MKNKSLFSRLLDNKKMMLIVSLLLSFVFWMVSSDSTTKTLNDVVVNYNTLSESVSRELKVFSINSDTVSVSVSGKRVFVDNIESNDIIATLDLFEVSEPGEYTFSKNDLDVSGENASKVSFDVYKPNAITVFVDKEASKTVDIVSDFIYKPDGYYVENNLPSSVTITGPETIVNTVECAYVSGEVVNSEKSDITNTYSLRLYDNVDPSAKNAKEVSTEYITMSYDSVDVTFRFMKINEAVPFTITYAQSDIKLPQKYYTITPSTISVAGPENLLFGDNAIDSISVNIGSLSKFKNQIYNESFSVNSVLDNSFVNKSNGVEKIKVQLDFSNFDMKTFDVPYSKIKVSNLESGYYYSAPNTYPVTVVGIPAAVNALDNTSFSVEYDFSEVDATTESTVEVPVKITVKDTGLCWVYRSSNVTSVLLSSTQ